jgi:itaconate CoA-transferase
VVTEWGVAELRGRSLDERARALIRIAHPSTRDDLEAQARELGLLGRRFHPVIR